MANVPDSVLHARLLAGDEQALATLDEQVGSRCMGWLMKSRGASFEDAQEAWSDALTAVWKDVKKIVPAKLSGYAFKVAANKAASIARKNGRRIETDAISLEDYMADKDIERVQQAPESALVRRLRECIERARERVRVVTDLLLSGAGMKEIAAIFKVKEDSAYQIKARTLRALRECMERSGA